MPVFAVESVSLSSFLNIIFTLPVKKKKKKSAILSLGATGLWMATPEWHT